MNEINEIKLPKGVDRIAVKQHDDKIVIEFIPEKPRFKDGDFVYKDGRIMIVKSYPNMYHANTYPECSGKVYYNSQYGLGFSEPTFRHATEEEKQLLIDAMRKDGKRWNAEKLTVEDIPQSKFKMGDILISTVEPDLTVIFDKVISTTAFDSIYNNGKSSNHGWCLGLFRHATKEEKQEFFDELEADGKCWNAEKLIVEAIPQPKFKVGDEVRIKKGISSKTHRYIGATFIDEMDKFIGQKLVVSTIWELPDRGYVYRVNNSIYDISEDWIEFYTDEPKKGDLAIFWDYDDKEYSAIRVYDRKGNSGYYDSSDIPWDNAVKWDGTKEQFEKVLRGEI